jgi:hypothetical protein
LFNHINTMIKEIEVPTNGTPHNFENSTSIVRINDIIEVVSENENIKSKKFD